MNKDRFRKMVAVENKPWRAKLRMTETCNEFQEWTWLLGHACVLKQEEDVLGVPCPQHDRVNDIADPFLAAAFIGAIATMDRGPSAVG